MAKRATSSGSKIPSRRRTKRPTKLDDLPRRPCFSAQIQSLDDPQRLCSSAQNQSQGAKRKRSHQLRSCSTSHSTIPSWGAKRARTALDVVPPALSGSSIRRRSPVRPSAALNSAISPIDFDLIRVVSVRRRDWSNLADGPAGLIAERVLADDVADYVRFRAVCTAWRRCAADPRKQSSLDSRFHPRRWFMLRENLQRAAPHRRRFMNVATGQCVVMDLPEIKGQCSFGPTAEGLLVLVDNHTLVVRLLNPFTRQLTELPSLAALLSRNRFKKYLFSRKVFKTCYASDLADGILSVKCAGLAGEGTVAIYFSEARVLAVAKPGDEKWMLVDRGTLFVSLLSFAGRFYCIDDSADAVMTVKTSENQPPQLVVAAKLKMRYSPIADTLHLVENDRELMLVHRTMSSRCNGACNEVCYRKKYEVYQVDLDARKTMPIRGLNGQAVFIGIFSTLSVCPKAQQGASAAAMQGNIRTYMGAGIPKRFKEDEEKEQLAKEIAKDWNAQERQPDWQQPVSEQQGQLGKSQRASQPVKGWRTHRGTA
ncbi:hypothetical protein E2562_018950 [Oryza meyeriana var. granulata]|uniref:KIB1-4 beta-propeller domain-containing protein n=1 Tax=Oryza meyeriana var. granulata TaxID=110450 RepID=A0A6G1DJR1_9ORYZ|nr:hypothetical protein E2562_018950 [Oryza meyeriana var. granulata]